MSCAWGTVGIIPTYRFRCAYVNVLPCCRAPSYSRCAAVVKKDGDRWYIVCCCKACRWATSFCTGVVVCVLCFCGHPLYYLDISNTLENVVDAGPQGRHGRLLLFVAPPTPWAFIALLRAH